MIPLSDKFYFGSRDALIAIAYYGGLILFLSLLVWFFLAGVAAES